jgi:hypothetical protein
MKKKTFRIEPKPDGGVAAFNFSKYLSNTWQWWGWH